MGTETMSPTLAEAVAAACAEVADADPVLALERLARLERLAEMAGAACAVGELALPESLVGDGAEERLPDAWNPRGVVGADRRRLRNLGTRELERAARALWRSALECQERALDLAFRAADAPAAHEKRLYASAAEVDAEATMRREAGYACARLAAAVYYWRAETVADWAEEYPKETRADAAAQEAAGAFLVSLRPEAVAP